MPGLDEAYLSCLETLRASDLDRYLACLLMPEDKRGPIAALYAFNAEIARIRDLIREPLPGEVRLQWWRDLLTGTARGEAEGNPVARGLLGAIDAFGLPRPALAGMTEARIFDLYDDPMPDSRAFELYAGETASALIQLSAMVLDAVNAPAAAEAAGHAGVAQLVMGTLLLLPIHRARRQVYIPGDILSATGLSAEAFLEGRDTARISAALSAFIGYGRDHLAKARAASSGKVGRTTSLAFLPVSIAGPVFDQAEKAGIAALDSSVQPSQLRRQWVLWRASRRSFA